jgi:Fe-S-cluster containining protein
VKGRVRFRFRCRRCANCCVSIRIQFSPEDFGRWVRLRRFDVLHHLLVGVRRGDDILFLPADDYVRESKKTGDVLIGVSGWYDPKRDEKLVDCPFLEKTAGKTRCRIYRIRPQACRNFPLKRIKAGKKDLKVRQCPALRESPR